jgi:hypothetical protein
MNLPQSSPFLSDTPAPPGVARVPDGLESELGDRLRWFVRLRWTAAGSLGLLALIGPLAGFPEALPGLSILAAVVLFYNTICWRRLTDPSRRPTAVAGLRASAVIQIVLDLGAARRRALHRG